MKRILAAGFVFALLISAPAASFDCIIRHGRIVDGTGNPAYFADVGIKAGRVVQIGKITGPTENTRARPKSKPEIMASVMRR